MSRIKFITDSASDIPAEDEKAFGIQIIPFPISFGEKVYLSRVDIDDISFYELLEKSKELPTTSQITAFQYGELFEQAWRDGYTDVINTTINSEGSGTYNSACLAAELFSEAHPEASEHFHIHNLDGASYTSAYGYAVVEGARRAEQGANAEEVLEFMRDWLEHVVIYFVPYTLKYASKSGRIPSAAAFVGELVGLKPLMRISDHRIVTFDKVRGEKRVIPAIAAKALASMKKGTPYCVFSGIDPAKRDLMEKEMSEAVGYGPAQKTRVGSAITINAGPDVVGVAVYEE